MTRLLKRSTWLRKYYPINADKLTKKMRQAVYFGLVAQEEALKQSIKKWTGYLHEAINSQTGETVDEYWGCDHCALCTRYKKRDDTSCCANETNCRECPLENEVPGTCYAACGAWRRSHKDLHDPKIMLKTLRYVLQVIQRRLENCKAYDGKSIELFHAFIDEA